MIIYIINYNFFKLVKVLISLIKDWVKEKSLEQITSISLNGIIININM